MVALLYSGLAGLSLALVPAVYAGPPAFSSPTVRAEYATRTLPTQPAMSSVSTAPLTTTSSVSSTRTAPAASSPARNRAAVPVRSPVPLAVFETLFPAASRGFLAGADALSFQAVSREARCAVESSIGAWLRAETSALDTDSRRRMLQLYHHTHRELGRARHTPNGTKKVIARAFEKLLGNYQNLVAARVMALALSEHLDLSTLQGRKYVFTSSAKPDRQTPVTCFLHYLMEDAAPPRLRCAADAEGAATSGAAAAEVELTLDMFSQSFGEQTLWTQQLYDWCEADGEWFFYDELHPRITGRFWEGDSFPGVVSERTNWGRGDTSQDGEKERLDNDALAAVLHYYAAQQQ